MGINDLFVGDQFELMDLEGDSLHDLALLGEGHIAYVKKMKSEDLNRIFPESFSLKPGIDIYALLSARGIPIVLTNSRAIAIGNAIEKNLHTVSLH